MHPPPGYPFEGPLPSTPPPKRDEDTDSPPTGSGRGQTAEDAGLRSAVGWAGFFLGFTLLTMATGFLIVALLITRSRAIAAASELAGMRAGQERAEQARQVDSPVPPSGGGRAEMTEAVARSVPSHPLRFLEGCSEADLGQIEDTIGEATSTGVPLYNDANFVGCYEAYQHGSRSLQASLPATCPGPRSALVEAEKVASRRGSPNARGWALRDAFDGLLDVIDRSQSSGVGNL